MKPIVIRILLARLFIAVTQAAVLFEQPPSATSTLSHLSATGTVCTWHKQQRIWEGFVIPTTQTIREIQWRGTYRSLPPAQFYVRIYDHAPTGIPDIFVAPLASWLTLGNADETPAGSVGGVQMYRYRFALPTPFVATGNRTYALQIYAFQPGVLDWGFQQSTGNGGHSVWTGVSNLMQDSSLGSGAGRSAFSLHDQVTATDAVISLGKSPTTGGTVAGAGAYAPGTPVTATATPSAGFTFLYWKEGTNTVSTDASYSFTAGAYRALVAHFGSPNHVRIQATAFPPIAGRPSGVGTFTVGQQVEIDVSSEDGFLFAGWYENDSLVSNATPYLFTAATNRNLEARYYVDGSDSTARYVIVRVRAVPPAGGTVSGEGAWAGYSWNTYIRATPGENYRFRDWWVSAAYQASTSANTLSNASLGYNWFYAHFNPDTALSAAPGAITIRWPSTAPGWLLQESPNLSAGSWSVTNRQITPTNGQNAVTVPTVESQRFFRLFRP
jgi:Divergent InlB B-repeat domain